MKTKEGKTSLDVKLEKETVWLNINQMTALFGRDKSVISIFYKDHAPPHFHAKYGDKMGIFSIEEVKLLEGNLPPRVISLVIEWAIIHKNELQRDWDLALEGKPLNKIEPLT